MRSRYALDALTPREQEVLALLMEGKSSKEMGQILCVSVKTVEAHLSHIFGKLGVASRAAAIAYAYRYTDLVFPRK